MINRYLLVLSVLVLLSGCGSLRVPDFRDADAAPVEEAGEAEVTAYEAPTQMAAAPMHSAAVLGLLQQARQQQAAGELLDASATLERALRIEPRNAYIWSRLAHLRMDQGMAAQAIDLATKSKTLAGADIGLQQSNWRLIAKGRRVVGDIEGARRAEERANLLNER